MAPVKPPLFSDIFTTFLIFTPLLVIQKKSFDELVKMMPYYREMGFILPLSIGIGVLFFLCYFQDSLKDVYGKVIL